MGGGVSGEGNGISQNRGNVFRSFSGDSWFRKWDVTSRRLGQLLEQWALGGVWVDASSSFRVFQVQIKGVCFLSTYRGPESGAEVIERPHALGTLEKIVIGALQHSVRAMGVWQLPEDMHIHMLKYTPPLG